MKIIFSPAKRMNVDLDKLDYVSLPVFMQDTEVIMKWMQQLSYEEAKKLWCCNDGIASLNFERFRHMDLYKSLTPAILSYEGIAYQYMAPAVFENSQFAYVQEHLRILSAFYGVLKPLDGVTPHRLEMQEKAKVGGCKNLYEFWGKRLYQEVVDESRVMINLASKEYSKCIEKYIQPDDTYITCVFGEFVGEKVVQKGVYAKMARGEMVPYMAEKKISDPKEMKEFDRLGYSYRPELSTDTTYIFIRETKLWRQPTVADK